MAQPNVAREPSMDEILASIRKIIESNEPGQAAIEISTRNTAASSPRQTPMIDIEDRGQHEQIGLTIDDALLSHDFSESLAASAAAYAPMTETYVEPARVAAPAETPAQQQPPLSLADIAARVRAASERNASGMRDGDLVAAGNVAVAEPVQRPAPESKPVDAFPLPSFSEAMASSAIASSTLSHPEPQAALHAHRTPFEALQALGDVEEKPVEHIENIEETDDQLAAVLASFAEAAELAVAAAVNEDAHSAARDEQAKAAAPSFERTGAAETADTGVVAQAPAVPSAVSVAREDVKPTAMPMEAAATVASVSEDVSPAGRAAPAPSAAVKTENHADHAATDAAATQQQQPVSLAASIGALVSPAVGSQVAQSFGALADAVEYKNRTSFDDMAREMLRPMLQEWLDDNLPTLVERLVREEIERVARGGHR